MQDSETTMAELRRLVAAFVAERNWEQFHTPKNLAMSAAIECAELMEHFQWLTPDECKQLASNPAELVEVGEELADVCCYLLALANTLQIDVAAAVEDKMRKNQRKYPAAEFRDRYR